MLWGGWRAERKDIWEKDLAREKEGLVLQAKRVGGVGGGVSRAGMRKLRGNARSHWKMRLLCAHHPMLLMFFHPIPLVPGPSRCVCCFTRGTSVRCASERLERRSCRDGRADGPANAAAQEAGGGVISVDA
eukprot:5703615-Pleurochrysis_carterae.AAC.1